MTVADWYTNVLELRQNAAEYRRRAQGTHFSQDHLAQLCARNAELWDAVSINSSRSVDAEQLLPVRFLYNKYFNNVSYANNW